MYSLPLPGAVLSGKFEIVSLLGEGGMGAVYAAKNLRTGKRVAVKWLHPASAQHKVACERLAREAQAAARVRHPNVVDVYDIEHEGDAIYLVMELLEGEPLSALLERRDEDPTRLLGFVLDAMRGVAAAHREGVVHRDIKPDNIFLAREGDRTEPVAKVLDFGISRLTVEGEQLSLTRTGATVGTPLYMSYEQLSGAKDLDGRTDVYAFGVILYEALTGAPPYEADTFSALVFKVATESPPAPRALQPGIAPELEAVVLRAMAKDRDARFPSIDALIRAIEPFVHAPISRAARALDGADHAERSLASALTLALEARAEISGSELPATGVSRTQPELPTKGPRSWRVPIALASGLTAAGGLWFVLAGAPEAPSHVAPQSMPAPRSLPQVAAEPTTSQPTRVIGTPVPEPATFANQAPDAATEPVVSPHLPEPAAQTELLTPAKVGGRARKPGRAPGVASEAPPLAPVVGLPQRAPELPAERAPREEKHRVNKAPSSDDF